MTSSQKILFLLSGDAENLSLVKTYCKLTSKGIVADCYATRNNPLDLYPFLQLETKVNFITELNEHTLDGYDVVICGRNCFDAPESKVLISFKGIIVADDTCFYEGNSVYGDVICVCGKSNMRNISSYFQDGIIITGCIKADYSSVRSSELWESVSGKYRQKVLYIESGHFPFGNEGRAMLAREFCRAVTEHPDTFFVVKPRFLEEEAYMAKHRNTEHLYGYIKKKFGESLPENLKLLYTHESMAELVAGADICLCTYCSAHIEAVFARKKLINIVDVPSIETANFRKNRFAQITGIMDLAECNIPIHCLTECLSNAKYAPEEYVAMVNGASGAVDNFIKVVENALRKTASDNFTADEFKTKRYLGYAAKQISILENRLDDFKIADVILERISKALPSIENVDEFFDLLNEEISVFMDSYIKNNFNVILENVYQRAYVLRYLHEQNDYETRDKLLSQINDTNDAAYCFYKALQHLEHRQYFKMKTLLTEYLKIVSGRKFALTDAEDEKHLFEAKKLLEAKENKCYASS